MEIPDVMLNILIGEGFEKSLMRLKNEPGFAKPSQSESVVHDMYSTSQ